MSFKRLSRYFKTRVPIFHPKLEIDESNQWPECQVRILVSRALAQTRVFGQNGLESLIIGLGEEKFLAALRQDSSETAKTIYYGSRHSDSLAESLHKKLKEAPRATYNLAINNLLAALEAQKAASAKKLLSDPVELRFQHLKDTLKLNQVELNLVKALFVMEMYRPLDQYLDEELEIFAVANRSLLAGLLDTNKAEAMAAFSGRLLKLGIIEEESPGPSLDLNESFFRLLDFGESPLAVGALVKAEAPILTAKDFGLDPPTLEMLKKLLTTPTTSPIHILFYGPKGVGKTQLARFLAQETKTKAFELAKVVKLSEYRDNLFLAHNFLSSSPNSVLIVDEADKFLSDLNFGVTNRKKADFLSPEIGWLDDFFRRNGPPCLWIVNDESVIPSSIKDLFIYSLKFAPLGAKARLEIWRREQKALGEELLPEPSLRGLAKEFAVSQFVIAHSLLATRDLKPSSSQNAELWLKKQLRSNLELKGQRTKPLKIAPTYRVEALTIDPPVDVLLSNLKAWRDRSLLAATEDRQGQKLLFYGPPGVGKTELSNYLAYELDLDLTHVRSSDIISKYVGESEANLANVFRQYENSLGVIIIDEVESFLYSRDMAVRSWELSLVNEFLTCLDLFTGLFIGTTNRPDSLDKAARRRLGRKVEFGPLGESGQTELFKVFLKPLSGRDLNAKESLALKRLTELAPADYSVVADNMKDEKRAKVNNLALIAALAQESQIRLGQLSKDAPLRAGH
ncbi:MAG: AAA family ATPase [Deltaproteobacteria bacterium]|jgi:AAA+ superfamily predicted ATPase|nr:AAA family ATPase [Deltaproteobacteria bacterium]